MTSGEKAAGSKCPSCNSGVDLSFSVTVLTRTSPVSIQFTAIVPNNRWVSCVVCGEKLDAYSLMSVSLLKQVFHLIGEEYAD